MSELFTGTYSSIVYHLLIYFAAYLVMYVATRIIERRWDHWYDRITPAVVVMCFVGIWEVSNILQHKGVPQKSVWDIIEAAVAVTLGVLLVTNWRAVLRKIEEWVS